MKPKFNKLLLSICFCTLFYGSVFSQSTTVYPTANNAVLLNPGKGWILYDNLSNQPQSLWDISTVGYSRYKWAEIQTAENTFNWSLIDDKITLCKNKGKKFAFGIFNISSSDNSIDVPEWVWSAGAQYITIQVTDNLSGNTYTKKVPVWDNSVFMQKQAAFVTALRNRYDGNPDVAFIDIRNFGNWGEWHLFELNGSSDISNAKKRDYIRMWKDFNSTPLSVPINSINNNDQPEDFAKFAVDSFGIGLRRDGLIHLEEAQDGCMYAYDKSTCVGEFFGSYEWLKNNNSWSDSKLNKSFNEGKFSYMGMGQWGSDAQTFYTDKATLINDWANKMGYWFKLTEATYTNNLGNGATGTISFKVNNAGVAPCYVNKNQTYVKIALLNSSNAVLQTTVLSGVNPFDWKPGNTVVTNKTFSFPSTSGGVKLAIGVFSNSSLSSPDIKLGNNNGTGSNWYILSDMPTTPQGPTIGSTYSIKGKGSSKEASVDNVSTSNGAYILIWEWVSSNAQRWVAEDAGDGYYKFKNVNSNKYLSVDNCTSSNGSRVTQWEFVNVDCQKWQVVSDGDGWYRILNKNGGRALSVNNAGTSNGEYLHLWDWANVDAQRWQFTATTANRRAPVSVTSFDSTAILVKKLVVSPNPVGGGVITSKFTAFADGEFTLILIDVYGRVIKSIGNGKIRKGELQTFTSNVSNINSGAYFMNLYINGKRTETVKVILSGK